ncbi:hypothetical protein ACHAWO_002304 [Cyclotella atomus]|uniref:Photosystem I assembly protein Ycf4 n=1 Tax=Cyclotella atomus TaxID=382360 RepID=A0ABD3Q1V6_9STRA
MSLLLQRTARCIHRRRPISHLGQVNQVNSRIQSHLSNYRLHNNTQHNAHNARHFSSHPHDANPPTHQQSSKDQSYSLLYARSPARSFYPRTTLAFSSFNTLYWLWYTFDFTPSVNASAYEKASLQQIDLETLDLLLVDTTMGYVGLGMALVIWGGSIWYPKHLVSAIWKSEGDDGGLAVSTLSLPFVQVPSILGGTNTEFSKEQLQSESSVKFFNRGEIGVVGDRDTNEILIKLDGDLGKKRGHLALQVIDPTASDPDTETGPFSVLNKKNYLLDIESEEEIVEGAKDVLLKALLFRAFERNDPSTVGKRQRVKEDVDDEEYVPIRPKFGKGKKKR